MPPTYLTALATALGLTVEQLTLTGPELGRYTVSVSTELIPDPFTFLDAHRATVNLLAWAVFAVHDTLDGNHRLRLMPHTQS